MSDQEALVARRRDTLAAIDRMRARLEPLAIAGDRDAVEAVIALAARYNYILGLSSPPDDWSAPRPG